MAQSSPPLRTVERAFEVIYALQRLNGASPAELAEHMNLPRSTAHDYLRTLESTGYVVSRDGYYQIGYKFLSLGGRLRNKDRFFHSARAETAQLAFETGELPTIAVEEHGECVTLHAVKGERSLDLGIYPGLRTPLHSHATGKVLLAHLPNSRIDEILGSGKPKQITAHTVTDVNVLRNELDRIREEGYAVDWDQQVIGMGAIAIPLVVDGELLGAISLSGPTGRIQNEPYQEELLQKLRESANTIMVSYQYGH